MKDIREMSKEDHDEELRQGVSLEPLTIKEAIGLFRMAMDIRSEKK